MKFERRVWSHPKTQEEETRLSTEGNGLSRKRTGRTMIPSWCQV